MRHALIVRLVLVIVTLGMVVPAVVWATSVSCDGTESTGSGANSCGPALRYAYPVIPEPSIPAGITDLFIGTDDPDIGNYTNWCMPAGWTVAIHTEPFPSPFQGATPHDPKTPHGQLTGVDGTTCPALIHFSGPVITAAFTFGFDHDQPSHDVTWAAYGPGTPDFANMLSSPVGLGSGPVHAPLAPPVTGVPGLAPWGQLGLGLLLLALLTAYVWRRRRLA
jgi:hypothetical protein